MSHFCPSAQVIWLSRLRKFDISIVRVIFWAAFVSAVYPKEPLDFSNLNAILGAHLLNFRPNFIKYGNCSLFVWVVNNVHSRILSALNKLS